MRRLLVDMDEVLCDFVGGALRVHGWTREKLEEVWKPGTWSIVEPMGLTAEAFWKKIDAEGIEFWEGLNPLPWFDAMVALLDRQSDPWYLCTSPSRDPASWYGKVSWIKKRFGKDFVRFILTQCKEVFANKEHILIDDNANTCGKFALDGGNCILFPSRHNFLYSLAENPVDYVASQLEKGTNHGVLRF